MNYLKHYNLLIERGKNRILDGYVERHHIIPRCLGGSDDVSNLVQLTPEEHYVAHQMLHKINPDVIGLAYAMALFRNNRHPGSNNKIYGWIKRKIALARTFEPPRFMSPQGKVNLSKRMLKTWEERKLSGENGVIGEKIRATRITNGSYVFTEEHKANISKGGLGKVTSEETKQKLRVLFTGRTYSKETLERMSAAQKGKARKPLSEEHKQNIRKALIGRTYSEETLAKMRKAQSQRSIGKPKRIKMPRKLWCEQRRGVLHTDEHKSKISEGLKKAYENGRKGAMSKLSDEQVKEIRQLLGDKSMMQKDLAAKYQVSQATICDLKHGRSYLNVI